MTLTPSQEAFWDLVGAATRCVHLREPDSAEALANAALSYAKARGYEKPHTTTTPHRYTDARKTKPAKQEVYEDQSQFPVGAVALRIYDGRGKVTTLTCCPVCRGRHPNPVLGCPYITTEKTP